MVSFLEKYCVGIDKSSIYYDGILGNLGDISCVVVCRVGSVFCLGCGLCVCFNSVSVGGIGSGSFNI